MTERLQASNNRVRARLAEASTQLYSSYHIQTKSQAPILPSVPADRIFPAIVYILTHKQVDCQLFYERYLTLCARAVKVCCMEQNQHITEAAKPVPPRDACPTCGSTNTYARVGGQTRVCRKCGNVYEIDKTEATV